MLYSLEIHPLPCCEERRYGFFNRSCTNDTCIANFDQHRTFGRTNEIGNNGNGTKLVGGAIIGER